MPDQQGDAALAALLSREPNPHEEKTAMDAFLLRNAQRYDFSSSVAGDAFRDIFGRLIQERFLLLSSRERLQPRDYMLRVLQCMRILMRDGIHRILFADLGGTQVLVRLFIELSREHDAHAHAEYASEMLVETLSILKRFAASEALCAAPRNPEGDLRLQRALVSLLSTREALVLQCVLVAIQQFVQVDAHLRALGQLECAEILLRILTDYEPSFKTLAAELIEVLLRERTFLKDVVVHDGMAAILSALHSHDVQMQVSLLRSLEQLAEHVDCAKELRQLGGINVLLALVATQRCVPRLIVGICSVLTVLALDDEAALQIRKANAVYLLGLLLLQDASEDGAADATAELLPAPAEASAAAEVSHELLAAHVFRTLRFVFSTERNRKIFRRLFPPDLFAAFIDLGHYARDLERYVPLARQLGRLSSETRVRMQEALSDINVIKGPARQYIKDYAVQELLGKGAFGNVYQVKKDTGETLYAMKQLPLDAVSPCAAPHGGHHDDVDPQQSANYLKREVQILSTLQHPNIINYYDSFQHGTSLYIVMELVEGATLLDHINSLAEKGQTVPEARIWSLFTQICLALRYIHKEKHVVHRDLTPSNIMINVDGVVKLADFGLARQRMGTNSVMDSVVGTVLYQCPEIIQHEAYGEKADVWSLGCILYQMAMLRPPFEGGNPLVVARTIVEGTYAPLSDVYPPTSLLAQVVSKLLCVEPERRPDMDAVAALISPVLMAELGRVSKAEHTLRAEVHMEREWRQRHEREATRNKEAVHRLFARHHVGAGQRGAAGSCNNASISQREALEPSPLRRSVPSRSPMLSISPSRIREIHDPCSRILHQLHKILFVSQLPPSMEGELSAERAAIEKYKRELFSHRSNRARNLKDEIHKVMSGAQEMIDLSFRSPLATEADVTGGFTSRQRITYEELQRYIEQVLEQTGYYALQLDDSNGAEGSALPLEHMAAAAERGIGPAAVQPLDVVPKAGTIRPIPAGGGANGARALAQAPAPQSPVAASRSAMPENGKRSAAVAE